jgi:phage tail sheath gpL-like
MAIPFNVIPQAGLRVPLFYAELNGAQTPYDSISRLLLCGQMLPSGAAEAGKPVHVSGDPRTLFGVNAMMTDMVEKARLNAPFQEIWALPMLDSNAGVKATGKITCGVVVATARLATVPAGGGVTSSAGDDLASEFVETYDPDPGAVANNTFFGLTPDVTVKLTSRPNTLDGKTLQVGDIVLAKDYGKRNGLWEVEIVGSGANGRWKRVADFNNSAEFHQGMVVKVLEGDTQRGNYRLATASPYTLDTTVLAFLPTTAGFEPLNASAVTVWIGEKPVQSILYTSDTSQTLAARLVAVINATEGCPVTAAVDADKGKVLLTARHAGTPGNTIWLDTDYYGTEGPVSRALFAFEQMSGGSGDPDFGPVLDTLSDDPYDWIVGPYTDGVNFAAFETLLNPVSGRWSPYQQIYGQYVGVSWGTVSQLMTQGSLWNSPTTSIFGVYRSASPSWCWAGALGGRIAAHLSQPVEMSRPLHTLDLIGILPPRLPEYRPNITDRNSLYYSGIGCYHVIGKQKVASIDRVVTNYRVNEWGVPDASWLDLETRAQSMYIIRSLKAAVTGQYGRAALMDENPEGLQGVATPREIKAVIVHEYKRLNRLGLVENPDLFASSLIVERSLTDANRVDAYLPIDVVNQLRIIAVNATIFLQRNQREQVAA